MKNLIALLVAACAPLLPLQAQAVEAATLSEFKEDATFKAYLYGVGQGWLWANARLASKNQPQLFCVPPTLGLNFDNYLGILEAKIKNSRIQGKLNDKTPVEVLLLSALEESFPCRP